MYLKLMVAAGLILAVGPTSGAYAEMMSVPPPVSLHSAFRTIADGGTMTVIGESGAYLQDQPSTAGKRLERLVRGTTVTVIEKVKSGTWAHVKADDKEGYIDMKLLK